MGDWTPDDLERGGYLYKVHSLDGDDWGSVRHASPEVGVGDVVLVKGRLCEVTRWVDVPEGATVRRLLEVRPVISGSG